jgi:hypothetical protein
MADKRGSGSIRKSRAVGPDYDESRYENPVGAGLDHNFGSKEAKSMDTPNGTTFAPDIPLSKNYDGLWDGD